MTMGHHYVPQRYLRGFEAPAKTVGELKEFLVLAAREGRINAETLARRLAEAEATEQKFQKQLPSQMTEIIETPWPFESMLLAIYSMWWRFLRSEGPSYFL